MTSTTIAKLPKSHSLSSILARDHKVIEMLSPAPEIETQNTAKRVQKYSTMIH